MKTKKLIHILTTGGTIEGLEYKDARDIPEKKPLDIECFFKAAHVSFDYRIERILYKDSRFITDADRELIGKKVSVSPSNKVLITHGTLTMVETAKFLGNMDLDKTIVLTGALILGTETNTDAPFNLGFAMSALQFLDNGVYIAMNARIFSWDDVRKNAKKNRFENL